MKLGQAVESCVAFEAIDLDSERGFVIDLAIASSGAFEFHRDNHGLFHSAVAMYLAHRDAHVCASVTLESFEVGWLKLEAKVVRTAAEECVALFDCRRYCRHGRRSAKGRARR